jgi:hypothetical protein
MKTMHNRTTVLDMSLARIVTNKHKQATVQVCQANFPYWCLTVEAIDAARTRVFISSAVVHSWESVDHVVRYKFHNIDSGNKFSTDSNGMEVMNRTFDSARRIEYSYFPVAKFIRVDDSSSTRRATVMTDRATGATSLCSGCIDIGIARNNMGVDMYGVHESVYDRNATRIEHVIVVEEDRHTMLPRLLQLEDESPPLVGYLDSYLSKVDLARLKGLPKTSTKLDPFIKTLLDVRSDGIMARVYNLHETESRDIEDVMEYIRAVYGIEGKLGPIEERSVDYNLPIDELNNQKSVWRDENLLKKAYEENTFGRRIRLRPFKYRTFRIPYPSTVGQPDPSASK